MTQPKDTLPTFASFASLTPEEQTDRGLVFTPREIAQQPATWQKTLAIFLDQRERIVSFLESAGVLNALEHRPTIVLVGAGTSDYIGHGLVLLLRRNWGCEVEACASTDLLLNLEDYCIPGRRYVFISFSRSGDSPEGVAVLDRAIAENPDIAHLVVTCNSAAKMIAASRRASLACAIVLDDAVNDRSLVMTSSFTNMVVMGQCLAHAWSIDEYIEINQRLVNAGRKFLAAASEPAAGLASLGLDRVFFVGSGALASVAKESSLKVLEMTAGQVKTMSETVLGLRHGPMAALDAKTLFVCFASDDARRALYARDLLLEIGSKQIAARRIVIGSAARAVEFAECCDIYIPVEDGVSDLYRPALDVLFGQLLGLYSSIALGLKPDAPSPGGVINRVVQPFTLY